MSGLHDVWAVPSSACDFEAAGAALLAPTTDSAFTQALTEPGTFYFSCSITGHCEAGMLLTVNVAAAGGAGAPAAAPTEPSASNNTGACSPPVIDTATGLVSVSCLSPAISMSPGYNVFPDLLMPSPYPADASVAQRTLSGQVVDAAGRAVPLSEVYLHHLFADYRFLSGEGTEVRRSPLRTALPAPYALVVDGAEFAAPTRRYANVHVINTVGVGAADIKACVECWCPNTDPPTGSIGCCAKCPSNSTAPKQDYFLQYNVTYSPMTQALAATVSPVLKFGLDVHGERW